MKILMEFLKRYLIMPLFGGKLVKPLAEKGKKVIRKLKDEMGLTTATDLREDLVRLALSFEGIHERNDNEGEWIEKFQRAVDGVAAKESWCMAFVQYCLKQIEEQSGCDCEIYKTEHCLTCWNKTDEFNRTRELSFDYSPQRGDIVIFNWRGSARGHTGIVVSVDPERRKMTLIEGNTKSPSGKRLEGVYLKERNSQNYGDEKFCIVGYLRPWEFMDYGERYN